MHFYSYKWQNTPNFPLAFWILSNRAKHQNTPIGQIHCACNRWGTSILNFWNPVYDWCIFISYKWQNTSNFPLTFWILSSRNKTPKYPYYHFGQVKLFLPEWPCLVIQCCPTLGYSGSFQELLHFMGKTPQCLLRL